jgi:N utilization substance protein B
MTVATRRRAREVALQVLYQLDVQEQLAPDAAVALFWECFGTAPDKEARLAELPDESHRVFAELLVTGVHQHLAEIDALIGQASRNWRLERMARVDRNLLRLAVFELKHLPDVPAKVAINEAIEIAKRFGTAESPAFINGILDHCLMDLGGSRK